MIDTDDYRAQARECFEPDDWGERMVLELCDELDLARDRLENALEHAREKRLSNSEQDPMAVKIIVDKRNGGFTWQAIADLLNQNYVKTPRGKLWFKASVQQVYKKWNGWI